MLSIEVSDLIEGIAVERLKGRALVLATQVLPIHLVVRTLEKR